jgi:hypothetical protein
MDQFRGLAISDNSSITRPEEKWLVEAREGVRNKREGGYQEDDQTVQEIFDFSGFVKE